MVPPDALGLLVGAVALGALHGVEPGHGWPVAATYALDRSNHVLAGLVASLVIGVGHLVSSLAMVAAFFWAKSYLELEQVNDPITVLGDVQIGGPVSIVAGVLLIGLGVREALRGGSHSHDHGGTHSHGHGGTHSRDHEESHSHDGPDHGHEDPDHGHEDPDHGHEDPDHGHEGGRAATGPGDDHGHDGHGHHHTTPEHDHGSAGHGGSGASDGIRARLRALLAGSGGHAHTHAHESPDGTADRGLYGIAWFAFVLGFAHEEEFEIIALCAGSVHCLELMVAYALTVIVSIVALTMLLIAGYRRAEDRVQRYTPYLPLFSAAVLVGMGVGFVAGVF